MTCNRHCLHSLLPKIRHSKALNSLRSRGHNYQLPQIEFNLLKNSFLNWCFPTFKLVHLFIIYLFPEFRMQPYNSKSKEHNTIYAYMDTKGRRMWRFLTSLTLSYVAFVIFLFCRISLFAFECMFTLYCKVCARHALNEGNLLTYLINLLYFSSCLFVRL